MGDPSGRLSSRVAVRCQRLFERGLSTLGRSLREAVGAVHRGRAHYERVEQTPYRVTVTGVRGKSTAVRWLNEALVDRDLETYAKVTGNHPASYHNLEKVPIERDGVTRLYENEREFQSYHPVDAAVVENQGIREYTTRLANELFDPQVVVLMNVRRDHQSTLGETLEDIARVFTRTMPAGSTVVSGDQNEAINDYLRREFEKSDIEFRVAAPPSESPFADVLGARSVYVVDETLRALELEPLNPDRIESMLADLHQEWGWRRLAGGGLVSNGAMMNDIESTELLRQFLVDRLDAREPTITPFVYTRRDRAGRTAAFVHYLDWLGANDLIDRVHVAGSQASLLERRTDPETVHHDDTEAAESVLDTCLADGHPVYLMGNTVSEFMRALTAEIDRRTLE